MNRNLFIMTLVLSILSGFLIISTAVSEDFSRQSLQTDLKKSVESLTMFQAKKFDAHYRTPNIEQIELLLQEQGIPLEGTLSAEEKIQTFKREWAKRNPTTVNPQKLRKLLEKERRGPIALMAIDAPITQFKSLVVPVEFLGTDTFDQCGITVTTSGPLHNEIAQPGARDNNTVWYDNTSPTLYNELYFGVGPTAGVVVNHPNLGAVDLRGNTMANYYLEQSGGMFTPTGQIYPNWLQAAHSEGWYGADACTGGGHNVRAHDLVREVVDLIKADNPNFAWQDFDADGDGIVDNFTVIHAGAGQEGGGGVQGAFAIWSHASLLNYPTGYLACTAGSTGCPARNIYVREYSMDPENIDVGVISEEFGHAAFGLPDIYATDTQASPSNWAIFESGSWNGPLGGMQPAPFPLWARALIGWSTPAEVNYDTGPVSFK
jgi:M6 family metalloprotease-like protein